MSIIRLLRTFGKYTVEIERKGALQNLPDITILGIDALDMNRLFLHRHHSFPLKYPMRGSTENIPEEP